MQKNIHIIVTTKSRKKLTQLTQPADLSLFQRLTH